jgi:hypothetical protein
MGLLGAIIRGIDVGFMLMVIAGIEVGFMLGLGSSPHEDSSLHASNFSDLLRLHKILKTM